jgi:hypothetical protein
VIAFPNFFDKKAIAPYRLDKKAIAFKNGGLTELLPSKRPL